MIAAKTPVRFKRPLAMVLAGPMVGVALVAAAAPIGVWLAGPPAVALPAPPLDPIPPALRARAVTKFGEQGAEDFFQLCQNQTSDCERLLDHFVEVSGESSDGRTNTDERRTKRKPR
jgi:hypothetical protein